jgi:hypothetical protein
LLTPRLLQPTSIHSVESELIDERKDGGLGSFVIARHGQGYASRCTSGFAKLQQVLRVNVVKCLDHSPAELLFDPAAFRHAVLDRLNAPIPLCCSFKTASRPKTTPEPKSFRERARLNWRGHEGC